MCCRSYQIDTARVRSIDATHACAGALAAGGDGMSFFFTIVTQSCELENEERCQNVPYGSSLPFLPSLPSSPSIPSVLPFFLPLKTNHTNRASKLPLHLNNHLVSRALRSQSRRHEALTVPPLTNSTGLLANDREPKHIHLRLPFSLFLPSLPRRSWSSSSSRPIRP